MAHSLPSYDREEPLNLELLGYDELGRLPTIGRSSDRESILKLQEYFTRSSEQELGSPRTREILANDFSIGGF
jgi:hypothetical protein